MVLCVLQWFFCCNRNQNLQKVTEIEINRIQSYTADVIFNYSSLYTTLAQFEVRIQFKWRQLLPWNVTTPLNNNPDAHGGHKEGANLVGSSNVAGRLQKVFDSTKAYFEEQLLLSPEQWVAFLAGAELLTIMIGTKVWTRFFDSIVCNNWFQSIFGSIDHTSVIVT